MRVQACEEQGGVILRVLSVYGPLMDWHIAVHVLLVSKRRQSKRLRSIRLFSELVFILSDQPGRAVATSYAALLNDTQQVVLNRRRDTVCLEADVCQRQQLT